MNAKYNSVLRLAAAAGMCLALTACATGQGNDRYGYNQQYDQYGNPVDPNCRDGNNVGTAILGAVAGGVLGNAVGGGTGRAVATVAGAAGGAYVGNRLGCK